jgi:twitching motility protein PilT
VAVAIRTTKWPTAERLVYSSRQRPPRVHRASVAFWMKPIEELLKNLGRAEVLEFGLVTNRLPSVNIGGKFEPVDDEAPSTHVLLQMLVTMGGSRYVEQLSERPVQWTTRLDGVGVIAVAAIMRKDIVQARFTVARRDTSMSKAPPGPGAGQPSAAPPAAPPTQQAAANAVAAAAAAVVAQQSRPAAGAAGGPGAELRRTQLGTGGPQPTQSPSAGAVQAVPGKAGAPSAGAQPASATSGVTGAAGHSSAGQKAAPVAMQSQPHTKAAAQQTQSMPVPGSPAASSGASPAAPPVAPGSSPSAAAAAAGPLAGAVPPPDDWDDDDEPTVQTMSPPVAPPQHQLAHAQAQQAQQPAQHGGPGEDPKPKPARKPGEVPSLAPGASAQPSAEEERAGEERAAVDRKAVEDRLAADRKVADERKAAEERAAHERKIIEERAAAERKAADDRKAAEERKLAEQRNVAERAVQERVAAERAAVEKRGAIERAAADRAAQAERAATERKAAERAKVERRISTPTSVDAVDVEITSSDSGTRPVAGAGELELDPIDNTVELTAPPNALAQQMLSRATAPIASAAVPSAILSAIPSTTPSAANVAEKDRPRTDGALVSFLAMAVSARATDIHIVAGRPLLLRVATDLLPRTQPVEAEHVERIVREIVPVRLRETLDTEGACDFAIEHAQHGRFRVHVSRQRTGFKLSMRVIPREIPTLAALALPEGVGAAAKYGQGLVLVTGPASHGKTSTLAAIVDILNRESARHVLTIEDPVEYIHPRKRGLISQREIGGHARSWGSAMKAALREDPDVIVLGELRDAETMRLAIEASETGHLVIATMSTPSAAKTVDRVIDLFPPAEQPQIRTSVAHALRLIIGQRLVPSADRTRLHAAVELLPSSIALYTLIRDARTFQIPSLQQRGRAQGVVRLDESLAELVRAQKVTLEVAKQFAESAEQLEAQATRSVPGASGVAARKG